MLVILQDDVPESTLSPERAGVAIHGPAPAYDFGCDNLVRRGFQKQPDRRCLNRCAASSRGTGVLSTLRFFNAQFQWSPIASCASASTGALNLVQEHGAAQFGRRAPRRRRA